MHRQRIARAERQLAVAQQLTHIGSWEWDVSTNHLSWSDELYRIYGLAPQSREITFDYFLTLVHPDDRSMVQREVVAALGRGDGFAWQERCVRPDGSIRKLDTIGEVSRDASGVITGLIGTCRDVTESAKREEQIRLYADIVQNVQIGLSVWGVGDPNDIATVRLLAFNPAAEAVARMPLGQTLGKPLLDIVPYGGEGRLRALITEVARDGKVREATVDRSRDPKNPSRAVSMKAFALPGKCVGVAIEDITEQTIVRRLQAAEQRVLEMLAEGVALRAVLEALALAVEEHSPPLLVAVRRLDAEGAHFRDAAAPHLPREYERAVEGSVLEGRAGEGAVSIERRGGDVATMLDGLGAAYRSRARAHGLDAIASMPILSSDNRMLGVMTLYAREPCAPHFAEDRSATSAVEVSAERGFGGGSPSRADLRVLARASHIAGIAIERRELEDQLRALTAHVESVREDERTGIAREIHDELGQALTALKMDLAWIGRRANEAGGIDKQVLLDKLTAMSTMTDEIVNQVRRISAELRPGVLDDLGLLAAIEWQAQEFEERTGTPCAVSSRANDMAPARDASTAIFRIFQESLTNIARHASATHVEVTLDQGDGWLQLEVQDDGKGMKPDAAANPRSLGLLGMRERARRLGGSVSFRRGVHGGTIVTLAVPLVVGPVAGDAK